MAANSTADSFTTMSTSSHRHLRPILVGYAFGPKKLSTMGLIMAEASRAQLSTVVTTEVPLHPVLGTSALTSAALKKAHSTKKPNVVFSLQQGGLKNIVRYFRSSCSSVGSEDTLTTATSTHVPSTTGTQKVRVSFVPLDLDSPLEEQHGGNFDAILHKLTEDILCLSTLPKLGSYDETQLQAISRVNRLTTYQKNHPHCSLVDHPSHVQVIMSRADISRILTSCLVGCSTRSGIPVRTPAYEIYNGTCSSLQPPLIAKPLTAAGTKKSHCMGVVLQQSGLSRIQETPCLLQEYVNHNAVLHKVYVLGNHVSVFERPSLPNLPCSCEGGHDFCEFDSQRPYPTLDDFGLSAEGGAKRQKLNSPNVVSVEEIQPVVTALKQAFGLELFGFDILVTFSEFLVVDVNYFPSYKEVSNFPMLLANYLTQRAIDGRINNTTCY
jgi:inositol-1,3,4-trisphosphate 5/6-kinase/inositol-tetrakisphosphate 1-kinase